MPKPGDFFLARASRWWLRTSLGWACRTDLVHSGIYIGNGKTVEASVRFKGGARVCDVTDLHEPQWSTLEIPVVQRIAIIRAARDMVGRPFPSGLAMAVGILRRHRGDITAPYADQPWWVRTLLNGEHTAYCLQVPYYAYRAAGIDLLPDGRPEGLVRPADLLPLVAAA